MLSFRYIVLFLKEFFNRFKIVLLVGILVGVIVFIAFRLLSPIIYQGRSERIGVTGRFRTDNLPPEILNLIGDGLTKLDEQGIPKPSLASSWETTDSGKTWTFKIRENAVWQDGTKVTSKTINYQFSDSQIERPDDKTIAFKLEAPFAPFPGVVSLPTFKKGLLGTGEWKVLSARLVGNNVQELAIGNKNKEKKIYKFYPTEERAKLAFKLGQVDKLIDIVNPEPFDKWQNTKVSGTPDDRRFVALFFNTNDNQLSDKSLRQALSYAIDKNAFNAPRALGPIPTSSWAFNSQVKQYTYDPDKAREMINSLPKEVKSNLNIKIVTIPVLLSTAEKITKNWEEIGVKTSIGVSLNVPLDYQALLVIFDAPTDPDQYALWHSTQESTNISHYNSARIDKLLEEGRVQLNQSERKKIYLDFQRFLAEDSPAAFLYHPIFYTIERK